MSPRSHLPIDPFLPKILATLELNRNLVIQASPGSGKTTRVPPTLLEAPFLKGREILVLVPRRLAAKMAALRVADERDEEVGGMVGYHFRFEKMIGPMTRLKFLTEGMLIRRLMGDPDLTRVGCVILDEFHERHVHSDVALAYLKHLQGTRRPDLRLVMMSATLDIAMLSKYLDDCPTITIEAPRYPVKIIYQQRASSVPLCQSVVEAVGGLSWAEVKVPHDVLVFLPGMADILRCADLIEERFAGKFLILPLHGDIPKERQALVFKESDQTKIILATNVAETSLTIDGVTTVIDSGLHRQASYSWWSGVPALKTKNISRASAIQRAGRAGRTAPGQCFRLYTKTDFEGRPEFDVPEIRRADLTQTILELKSLRIQDPEKFSWFEAPAPQSLQACVELLFNLGAIAKNDIGSELTVTGQDMASLPLHPRLARFLLEAQRRGVLQDAAVIAALISEGELEALDVCDHLGTRRHTQSVQKQIGQILSHAIFKTGSPAPSGSERELAGRLAYSLLHGFPDRVAKKRAAPVLRDGVVTRKTEEELVFCFGGSGTVPAVESVSSEDYFVILDVQERQGVTQSRPRVHVRSLCPVKAEWLLDMNTTFLAEHNELGWDGCKKSVVALEQLNYGQIVLTESRGEPKDLRAATRVLFKSVLGLDEMKLTHLVVTDFIEAAKKTGDPEVVETLLTRLELLRRHFPQTQVPEFSHDHFGETLMTWMEGAVRLEDIHGNALADRILAHLPHDILLLLRQNLPTSISLPSGRTAKILYEWGKTPWVGSRLQDFFGWSDGPKILGGRVPLTLHLLAPNQRAVQVTSDLRSFWRNTYPEIRPQLARRYPRHAWPEKPG